MKSLLENLGLDPDAVMDMLAKMFSCDFVLANRDRHYRNFGIIRNVETLEVTRMTPLFDTGSCLWSDAELLEASINFGDAVARILGSNPNITERRVATVAEHAQANTRQLLAIAE